MRCLLLITIVVFLFTNCGQGEAQPVEVKRDTTITRANAFSDLFLDSVRVEQFIAGRGLEDSVARRFRNFYKSRNYQFAWFTGDGLAEQAGVFWNLHNHYVDYAKDSTLVDQELHSSMTRFMESDSTASAPPAALVMRTELGLTQHFFDYVRHAYAGKMDPETFKWHIPRKKVDAVALLDSLIRRKGTDPVSWEPLTKQYRSMRAALVQHYDLARKGGWDTLPLQQAKVYRAGAKGTFIALLKKRLELSGDVQPGDTTAHFNQALEDGVRRAQSRFGLAATGVVTQGLLKALNVPVEKRIEQLLINMERMRWMPAEPTIDGIIANIPEFKIHVYEGGEEAFEMDVVVGKAGNNTVVFNDQLKYIVFSPYWNIPPSIIKGEILPALRKNPNYLAAKNMEQTGMRDGLPVIRQKPGGSNSLGRVKFLFPNSYNIYFHDSPAKSLFARQKRDFSHGCIRLAEPKKLAAYLLRDRPEWTDLRIEEAMSGKEEKWVTLPKAVPVLITYFTTWVDAKGLLHFREDIYDHDKEMAARLFIGRR